MPVWITTGDPNRTTLRLIGMQTLARHLPPYGALASATAIRYSRRTRVGGSERSGGMVNETPNGATSDAARWAALIEAVATRRDREAFATLFEHFAPRIKTFMRRSGASEQSADEFAQEALLAVWSKAGLFDPASVGATAWIFTIARNLRIDVLRREKRAGRDYTVEIDPEFHVDEGPLPDAGLAVSQVESRVRNALTHLSEDQQRVIELSFFDEKAHAEIAQTLQIPLGTVKSRLRLAMNRLRGLLGDLS
ncbi:MAG: sigma-70 family RNA polymerase sigma factor [Bradyrhizobium sp.]|uniref:sigma-70 family RNA polymerase sigma factor n=1 Tax=Bradyrhizobium sp. TaxID=376 RepID=UPI00271FF0DC|nr:sigma-70 family RNA polymerase sigma factor [Bradyrhizobium sp.]MDO8396421.1 sigma-70 family RNA polymerase sigma factor [Bradyrhizobium sp.]